MSALESLLASHGFDKDRNSWVVVLFQKKMWIRIQHSTFFWGCPLGAGYDQVGPRFPSSFSYTENSSTCRKLRSNFIKLPLEPVLYWIGPEPNSFQGPCPIWFRSTIFWGLAKQVHVMEELSSPLGRTKPLRRECRVILGTWSKEIGVRVS